MGKSKNGHGGKRKGSGRKPSERVPYATRLHPDRIEWVKEQSAAKDCAECEVVEEAIDRRRAKKK